MLRRHIVAALAKLPGILELTIEVHNRARSRGMFAEPTWRRDPLDITDRRVLRVLRNIEAKVIGNAKNNSQIERRDCDLFQDVLIMTMNIILLERHSDIFSMGHIMESPVALDEYGRPFSSTSMRLNSRLNINDYGLQSPPQTALDARLTYADIVAKVDEIARDLRQQAETMEANGKFMAPYIPIWISGPLIDPTSFDAYFGFMSQYGVVTK